MKEKVRLDVLLVQRGIVASRELAQSLIMRGDVLIDNVVFDKAGTKVAPDVELRVRGDASRFVSRGGDKIDPLFDHFGIILKDRTAIDIGASTGGFTDSMLQRGASLVYAIDVGTNQLALKLREDSRVRVFEQTHVRDMGQIEFYPAPSFATIDVSFIGVRKVLPYVLPVLSPRWQMLALIKPQFELGPEFVEKGGLVRSEDDRKLAVRLVAECAVELGAIVGGTEPAALKGAKSGNQEYFIFLHSSSYLSEAVANGGCQN